MMIRQALFAAAAAALIVIPTGPLGAGARAAAAPAADATVQGKVSHPKGNADLVVYIATAPGTFAAPATHPAMDQKGMAFTPHVLTILLGTTVDFLNSDGVNHNVFSPDHEGYNLGTWPKGVTRSYTFQQLGAYTQLCSIHPEMKAFIVVLQNPYDATTNASGYFEIENVPLGHYELKVWGEHLTPEEMAKTFPVDLVAGGSSTNIWF